MARKRMLQPEFFTSGPVNNLPISAMVTFAGLWVYFDDAGRGEDDAALIKSVVWPRRKAQTEARVASDLAAIAAEHLICRYEVADIRLIHSPSWHEHQKISHPTPSKLPPCPFHEAALYAHFLQEHGDGLDRFRPDARDLLSKTGGRSLWPRGRAGRPNRRGPPQLSTVTER